MKRLLFTILILSTTYCSSGGETKSSEDKNADPKKKQNIQKNTRSMEMEKDNKYCKSGDCENGTGNYEFQNNDKYSGSFRNGFPEGDGSMEYANGDRYKGNFKAGKKNGTGEYFFKNGDHYKGEFSEGVIQGKGLYSFANGNSFQGDFQNNGKDGSGVFKEKDSQEDCNIRNFEIFCKVK